MTNDVRHGDVPLHRLAELPTGATKLKSRKPAFTTTTVSVEEAMHSEMSDRGLVSVIGAIANAEGTNPSVRLEVIRNLLNSK